MNYLIAIRVNDENEIFSFPTAGDREDFISGALEVDPELEYALSEVEK